MKFLVIGANGFIASAIVEQLLQAGHQVVLAVRKGNSPFTLRQVTTLQVDMNHMLDPAIWIDYLQGVDGVINCAGILRESVPGDYERIHYLAPQALARACATSGIQRFIQISAVGDAEHSDFIASKHRFDEWLLTSGLNAVVIRPSVVVSLRGSYGGTSLLRALAALPGFVVLPGRGDQKIQPVLLEDLSLIVVRLLEQQDRPNNPLLYVAGPEPVALKDFLVTQRQWLQLSAGYCINIPLSWVRLVVRLGQWFGRGPLGETVHTLLKRGNTVSPEAGHDVKDAAGIQPRSVIEAMRHSTSFVQDRWHARLYSVRPVILLVLSCLWILSGLSGVVHGQEGFSPILDAMKIPAVAHGSLVLITSALDIALGLAIWHSRCRSAVLWLMTFSLLAYTSALAILAPEFWFSPLGGLAKNLPLLVLLAICGVLEKQR